MKDTALKSSLNRSVEKHVTINKVDDKEKRYARGRLNFKSKSSKNPFLKKKLEEANASIKSAVSEALATEILLPAESGYIEVAENEKTYKLKQSSIKCNVDLNTQRNAFDLQLTTFGPYICNYTRNGR